MMEYMELEQAKIADINEAAKEGWRLITYFRPQMQHQPGVYRVIMERTKPVQKKRATNGNKARTRK